MIKILLHNFLIPALISALGLYHPLHFGLGLICSTRADIRAGIKKMYNNLYVTYGIVIKMVNIGRAVAQW